MRANHPEASLPLPELSPRALTDALFDEAGAGRCLLAPDGTVVRANAEWLRWRGSSPGGVVGARVDELFAQPGELAAAHARARAGHQVALPRHARLEAGRESWWEGSLSPVSMEGGAGLLVTVRETSPLAAAGEAGGDEALLQSEWRYRSLFENMTEGFALGEVILDASGEPRDFRLVEMNGAFQEQTGLVRDEVLGRPMSEVLPRLEPHWLDTYASVVTTGVSRRFESYNRDLDRHFAVFAFRPSPGRFAALVTDNTPWKRIELTLRESEARYRTLFESIDEGFCIVEVLFDGAGKAVDYRFLEVNRAFERHTGLAGAAGRRMRELAPSHEEHWFEIYGAVAVTGEPIRFENRAEALGRVFDVFAFRVGAPEGHRVAILFNDITVRKRAEEALREADRRKSDFLGVLSHELRNPLAPIRSSTFVLERAPAGSVQAARAREVIRRQTEHLTRLVDDLLDVERIARGKVQLHLARLDVREVVRETCDDHRSVLAQGGLELRLDVPLGPVWVDADPTRVSQVVGNLLHNAAKFTPPGGRVEVEVAAREGLALVAVRDTGGGMAPEEVERMFLPFEQGEQELARTRGGLGLGLALVKGLVELHGGSVRATSAGPGRGSEFAVALPSHAAGAPGRGERHGRAAVEPRRILVIEDNEDAGQTLADLLELEGHRADLARDGREGLALARELRPDVVLCDVGLPDLSGYEVARALRADPALRGTRLVALTGYAQPEDRQRAREAGFDAHLPKPPDLEELKRLIEQAR